MAWGGVLSQVNEDNDERPLRIEAQCRTQRSNISATNLENVCTNYRNTPFQKLSIRYEIYMQDKSP